MKSKIILAVAGAGKTFQICNNIDIEKRNLILSYTNENISNLTKELTRKYGCVPQNTIVMTFDKFLLRYFIWPYYKIIQKQLFKKKYRENKNLLLRSKEFNPQKMWEMKKTSFYHYFQVSKAGDYILYNGEISTLALVEELKFNDGTTLFDKGMNRINYFFDVVYIDEFQDYRKDKYNLMVKIMQNVQQGFMYGDFYQHSVSGQNNNGLPFCKSVTYNSFKKNMLKNGFEVDDESLIETRRCPESVCEFIRKKLDIAIYSDQTMRRVGNVEYVFDNTKMNGILMNNKLKIISLNNNKEWHSISYGLSKGNTYESTLVVIPDKYLHDESQGIHDVQEGVMKNKIYVALSRSIGDTFITSNRFMCDYFSNKN